MRLWLFHPLIFYPLATLLAVAVIALSVKPQNLPRNPAPAAAQIQDGALVFAGPSFNSPGGAPNQYLTVMRDFWGNPRALRVAIMPNQPAPAPGERGVRLLLTPADAARLDGRELTVDVSYNPLPVNAASGLAVSLEGAGPSAWVSRPIAPQRSTARFELPALSGVRAIGLRAVNQGGDEAFGLEITRIRITPHTSAATPH
jgi:hypothetical protein